ncbi:hypothetical protein DE146DRAFT_404508 [Phaeosphaeria sp. MPI-PUGE-AT-0046c]|nr:hypothetical protein DE146DRAFT_404508 [Phaeosphaeria sp. MPI-PUGE-AT-0046c]
MSYDRALRTATLLTTALALPLLIGCTALSLQDELRWRRRRVSAFCFGYIPLAMTVAASTISIVKSKRLSKYSTTLFDLAAAISYIAVLLPIWTYEVGHLNQGGVGLLIGYTTAPMIVNMLFHIYIFMRSVPYMNIFKTLFRKTEHECPNCQTRFVADSPQTSETSKESERYSLLRGEQYLDEDAVPYVDSRPSEECLHVRDGPEDVEEGKGKGAIKL